MAFISGLINSTFIILLLLCLVASADENTESLLRLKDSLENINAALSSWNESNNVPPCTGDYGNWYGVVCYKGHVWGLQLENMKLKGTIDLHSLKDLPYLRTISFMDNEFDTTWPELNMIVGLKSIYLSNNKFHGEIPDEAFEGMHWLKKIYLSNNQFTGSIPSSLASLPRLLDLRLEGNQFSGRLPKFRQGLKSFSVANNQLEGEVPASLRKMPASSFSGNAGLCGAPLDACPSKKPSRASIIVLVVLVCVAALFVIGAVIFVLHRRRRRQQGHEAFAESRRGSLERNGMEGRESISDVRSERSVKSHSSSRSRKADSMRLSFVRDDREVFGMQELLRANAEILGSSCYSSSYKAALSNKPTVVVKRFKQLNNVGRGEFQEHMHRMGRLSHPNLLPLVAYYYRKEEKLLITEFVQNGSLAIRLHGHQSVGEESLNWPTRLKIVKGTTKALEYLYKEMSNLITPHGNLKSSNVLLTDTFDPILNDYGLIPVIDQDLAPDIMVAYKSPEYLEHGRITKKTDVWSLGILILEILTGKFPANFVQGRGSEVSLADWVESVVPEEWSSEVFDPGMVAARNSDGEMVKLLKIALACCEIDVEKRWDLKEVVERIQELKERDHDDDYYSSYASEGGDGGEVDKKSTKAMSDEFTFSIN